jgi:hypothetical protein
MSRILLLGLTTCLAWANSQARECHGVSFPEQLRVDDRALVLNGLGIRKATIFKVNVYVAALYLPQPAADASAILAANSPYVVQMHFVRSVGAPDLVKGWTEGFERNSQYGVPATDARVATVRSNMGDVKSGQELRFAFGPGRGVDVEVNGIVKGTVSGDDFGRALLALFIGVAPNPELKSGLLGGKCE